MPIFIGMTRPGRQVRRITLGQPKKKRRPRKGRVQGGNRAAFATPSWVPSRIIGILRADPFYYICGMPFFTKSNLVDLRAEAEQLSICVEHFLYASERVVEGDYKTKGFYDNCIEKCNGRLKAIHFLMESIRQNRPVSEEELEETLPDFLNCQKNAKDKK